MRTILRNLVLAPVVLAAAAVASTSAMAEVTVKVPFNFTVAGKNCPAGTYSVNRDTLHGLVTLKGVDAARSFNWVLGPGDSSSSSSKVTLQFDELGQNHFLRAVKYGSLTTSRLDKNVKETAYEPAQLGEGR
jgi:hypothetical protein